MMKKVLVLVLAITVLFNLTSCKNIEVLNKSEENENQFIKNTFFDVLTSDKPFYMFTNNHNGWLSEVDEPQSELMFLDEYFNSHGEEWDISDEHDVSIGSFAVVDMDGDGVPEVIITMTLTGGEQIVLHYWNGEIYGCQFGYRAIKGLKKDGRFHSSAGAAFTFLEKLQFTDGVCESVVLANTEDEPVDGQWEMIYFIDGERVPEEEYRALFSEYENEDDAEEYSFYDETFEDDFNIAWNNVAN